MRTLTLGMNVSLDGFVATPDDGLDWMFPNFSPELMADTEVLLGGVRHDPHGSRELRGPGRRRGRRRRGRSRTS